MLCSGNLERKKDTSQDVASPVKVFWEKTGETGWGAQTPMRTNGKLNWVTSRVHGIVEWEIVLNEDDDDGPSRDVSAGTVPITQPF